MNGVGLGSFTSQDSFRVMGKQIQGSIISWGEERHQGLMHMYVLCNACEV